MARTEVHSGDLPTRQIPPIEFPDDKPFVRDPETIELVDKKPPNSYLADLAFAEENVTVRLERGSEKYAPEKLDFYVNGVPLWVRVGIPTVIKRKYLEVIARAHPFSVETVVVGEDTERPQNLVRRSGHAKYPFSVIEDKNPRGAEWLQRLMMES